MTAKEKVIESLAIRVVNEIDNDVIGNDKDFNGVTVLDIIEILHEVELNVTEHYMNQI